MWKTALRRLLILIPQLILISLAIFILAYHMPGDALSGLLDPNLPLEVLNQMREDMGLNNPWYIQYWDWVTGMFRGDFGRSTRHALPVLDVVGERIWNTFFLGTFSIVLTYLIAIPLGVISGKYNNSWIDKGISFYTFVTFATPTIVMAIVMIFWFSPIGLGWFPLSGTVDAIVLSSGTPFEILMNRLHHMALPAITSALVGTTGIIFTLRANIIDKKYSDYITLARSKGVPINTIFGKHILRNSLVPTVASIGLVIVGTLTGSVFVELVFNFSGIGLLFLESIIQRDFPVANFLIMFFSVITAFGVLLSDIILTLVDPRIRIK